MHYLHNLQCLQAQLPFHHSKGKQIYLKWSFQSLNRNRMLSSYRHWVVINTQKRVWEQIIKTTVELPVNAHSKFYVVYYGRRLLMRIGPHGFPTEKKPRCLYYRVDNLLHAISKLQCRYFHVVAKNSFCTPNTRVHTVNIEMRPCIMWLLARG